MKKLTTPLKKTDILKLKAGEEILLTGTIFTARDRAHKFLIDKDFPKIKDQIIYHCGPIVKKTALGYQVISAGPTTSARMNMYEPKVIKKFNIPAVIGKGGMDSKTINAMKGKCVYFSGIGGAGAFYSDKIRIKSASKLEFGLPEAIWEFEVKDFPLIVAIDSKGHSIYEEVKKTSDRRMRQNG